MSDDDDCIIIEHKMPPSIDFIVIGSSSSEGESDNERTPVTSGYSTSRHFLYKISRYFDSID
jgi:hypothetical protein